MENNVRKRMFALLLAGVMLCCALALGSCGKSQPDPAETAPESEGTGEPTGYPEGNVQREYVFADGRLFVYGDAFETALPGGLRLLGTVQISDGTRVPDVDLAAANVPLGAEIYAPASGAADHLYVRISAGRCERFVPEKAS